MNKMSCESIDLLVPESLGYRAALCPSLLPLFTVMPHMCEEGGNGEAHTVSGTQSLATEMPTRRRPVGTATLLLIALPAAAAGQLRLYEVGTSVPEPGSCALNRTLHLIRHAEGWHNIDEITAEREQIHLKSPEHTRLREAYGIAWMLLEQVHGRKYHDPLLTPRGREQAYKLRSALREDVDFHIDAVAVSPMRRTILTAMLALPQLENAAAAFQLDDPATATPAVLATDLLRERVGPFMPDSRLTRSELERQFGSLGAGASINFGDVEEADALFADGVERDEPEVGSELLASRAQRALEWLAALPAEHGSIAVVSHKHFLAALTTTSAHGGAARVRELRAPHLLLCSAPPPSASSMEVDGELPVKPIRRRVKTMGGSNDAS